MGQGNPGIERSARLKLDRLEAAAKLSDLAVLPGNRFEALKGDRKGQYGIRIKRSVADLFCVAGRIAGPRKR